MSTRFSFQGRFVANSYSKYDIPVTQVEFGLKMVLLIEIMFAAACTLTKLSMLMLVRRMLAGAALFWRRVVLGAVWVVSLQGGLFCIILVFQCRSVYTFLWDRQT